MAAPRPAPRLAVRLPQRSVRGTAGVCLLGLATLLVLVALATRSPWWLGLCSVSGLVLSWTALRLMWAEVLQSRRVNAADRASAAKACRHLITVRAAEHAEHTTAMTERLATSHLAQRELEGLVAQLQTRAQEAESRLARAQGRCRTLEEALAHTRAEETGSASSLAAWEGQAARPGGARSA